MRARKKPLSAEQCAGQTSVSQIQALQKGRGSGISEETKGERNQLGGNELESRGRAPGRRSQCTDAGLPVRDEHVSQRGKPHSEDRSNLKGGCCGRFSTGFSGGESSAWAWGQHPSMISREWGDLKLCRAHIKAFKMTLSVSFSVAKRA